MAYRLCILYLENEDKEYVTFNVCMNATSCPSTEISSSSVEFSSSSSVLESSSSEQLLLSSEAISSSSEEPLSSSEEKSSSSEMVLSSSEYVESSSSEGRVSAFFSMRQGVRVHARYGSISVYAPQQGSKVIRLFSPIGSLLLERSMDGSVLVLDDLLQLGESKVILSVAQGNTQLFTGMIRLLAP